MGILDFFRKNRNRESQSHQSPRPMLHRNTATSPAPPRTILVKTDEFGRLCAPTVLDGRFRIVKMLGQGGGGITYLASDIKDGSEVAIKEFYPKNYCERDSTTGLMKTVSKNWDDTISELKRKFLKEARTIAKFNHPYVISGEDVFENNGTAYYVMDFIKGRTLYEIVTANGGPLPSEKALEYIVKAGIGLSYIHSLNMTHMDIKPHNIMVRDSDDSPLLIDFGISKHYDEEGHNTTVSLPGRSKGYSPVEVESAKGVETFSPQTDVYSLGATLYFLLSGERPPEANDLISEELSFPSSFPQEFISPIVKAMRPNRRERFPTIHDFIETLVPGYESKFRLPVMYDIEMEVYISGTVTYSWPDLAGKELKFSKEIIELKNRSVIYTVSFEGKQRSTTKTLSQEEWNKLYDFLTSYLDESTECRKGYSVTTPCFNIFFKNKIHSLNHVIWVSTDKGTKTFSSNRLDTSNFRGVYQMWEFFVKKIPMLNEMRRSLATECTQPASKDDDDTELAPQRSQRKLTGTINGHEWVDLGLPSGLKWATCNVGASSPSDYGSYFAWGETSTKFSYTEDNSTTYERNFEDISGDPNYDAARANWGGTWRLPTFDECKELVNKCKWTWTTNGGHNGYKVTGPNGSSIFLPAGGNRYRTSLNDAGTVGNYWCSTPNDEFPTGADILFFFSSDHNSDHRAEWENRFVGLSVRPVVE